MKLAFLLRFHTRPGQSLYLSGAHPLLGGADDRQAIALQYVDTEFWGTTIDVPAEMRLKEPIPYHYVLREPDGSLVEDWGQGRFILLSSFDADEVLVRDAWNHPGYYENAFYTEPFKEVLLKSNHTVVQSRTPAKLSHTFHVKSPLLTKGQTLCLLGGAAELGNWNTQHPVLLSRQPADDYFIAHLDLSQTAVPVEYKYGVYDVQRRHFVCYEDGVNRRLIDPAAQGKHTILNDGFAILPSTTWKGAGVAIPVFGLRSESSFGVGEFTDLKLLVDWCEHTGLRLIQVLPVNDTIATHTWTDSYPYAAISAFALHPLYLNLNQVATAANLRRLESLEPERKRLNALSAVDYEAVMTTKLTFLKEIFPSQRASTFAEHAYKDFFRQNSDWLVPYAAFSYLRDLNSTPDASTWPAQRTYDATAIAALAAETSPAFAEIALHYFIQYHLHRQLKEATQYAHSKNVILKGDIAIGVYRHGADAWESPGLYRLGTQAGAPPDAFAVKGQNWGFPTYNWHRMKEDGFAWWKRRFQQMGEYFDAFRVDHILGFFRIWSIPLDAVEGILGHFVPALPVKPEEFERLGVAFDSRRLARPYITDKVLSETFGTDAADVAERFLARDGTGTYALRPEFATQRLVEHHFAALRPDPHDQKLKSGLFDLISNVVLLEAQGSHGPEYHFRFGMESTSSFQALDPHSQTMLRQLYVDYFFARQEAFWRKQSLDKLPALKRVTNMLVCGEDLGLVPACVPEVMQQLGILSLEIQRMPKSMNQDFFRPREAPYLSVITPSTHDMSTIRGWWQEDRQVTQKFYNQELGQIGTAPETCEPWINLAVINQHLASPAMWSIFQLQDLLGISGHLRCENPTDERINVPANPKNYWRYRMHLSLETLLQATAFNQELRDLVRANGRPG